MVKYQDLFYTLPPNSQLYLAKLQMQPFLKILKGLLSLRAAFYQKFELFSSNLILSDQKIA